MQLHNIRYYPPFHNSCRGLVQKTEGECDFLWFSEYEVPSFARKIRCAFDGAFY